MQNRSVSVVAALAVVTAGVVVVYGTERHVPADYPTIQAAVNAAENDDEVVIADGTYGGPGNSQVLINAKRITVRSMGGREKCVVDLDSGDIGILVSNALNGTRIEGLTVQNGSLGINIASNLSDKDSAIVNCRFTGNGQGISIGASFIRIADCIVDRNNGWGVSTSGGGPRIVGCRISENLSAGVICSSGAAMFVNCAIVGNINVSSFWSGGGVLIQGGNQSFANCVIADNLSEIDGGGIECASPGSATLTNCTITRNLAVFYGGGFHQGSGVTSWMRNCVIWGNTAGLGEQIATTGPLRVAFSDIEGGESAVFGYGSLIWGLGNLDGDPRFGNPEAGEFRLSAGSPCIDAGDNYSVPLDTADLDGDGTTSEVTPFDMANLARFQDDVTTPDTGLGDAPIVDMGAYEYALGQLPCVPCDLNCDGSVNQFDIQPFIVAIATHAGCSPCAGDADVNGTVNAFDINGFIDCLIP